MRALQSPLLLLSAGDSTRMGEPKALLDFQGRPWIVEQIERFRRSGGGDVTIVLGRDFEKIAPVLTGLGVRIFRNESPEKGAFSSVKIGLKAMTSAFLVPIDVPAPISELWAMLESTKSWVSIPTYQGRGGHPIYLKQVFCEKLKLASIDSRLDLEIHALPPEHVIKLPCEDPVVLLNLNDRETWENYLRSLGLFGLR